MTSFILAILLLTAVVENALAQNLNSHVSEWWLVDQLLLTQQSPGIIHVTLTGKHWQFNLLLYKSGEDVWGENLLSGHIQGERKSSASGYLNEEQNFIGHIHLKNVLYHVEPAHRYNIVGAKSDSVMYRTSKEPLLHSQFVKTLEPPTSGYDKNVRARAKRGLNKRKSLESLRNRTCVVLLAADHLFFKHIGKESVSTTTKELLLHLYEANKIYRSTDFDFDGRSDNVGFAVGNVTIFQRENMAENKFFGEIKSSSDYLVRWSEYDHSSYCLALCFTYRDFESGVLGLAYVGAKDRTGGICDQRYAVNGQKASFNTGIVSMMNFGAYVGHEVSFIILAHELGHNFGASHDPDTKMCSPGSQNGGNYIMYDKATNGDLPHNNLLSLCSRQDILDVLLTPAKTSCFREADSYCGNGIKEWDEECDCGNNSTCHEIDPCCTPALSTVGTPCTVRTDLGYLCSPAGGDCCTEQCTYASNITVCKEEAECSSQVFCSGESGKCGVSKSKGLLTLCNEGQNTCTQDGRCQGSVCQLQGLQGCQCTDDELSCDVCCVVMETGICTSTRHLDFFNHTYQGAGQACKEYSGYCNENHKCVTVNLEDPLSSLEDVFSERSLSTAITWIQEHWYYSLSALAAVVTLIVMFKYTYVRRVPIKRALTRVKSTLLREPEHMVYTQADLLIKHHKPMSLEVAVQRLTVLFPTAELHIVHDTACHAANEEIAVKRLLALDYPMSRLAVTLPLDENGMEVDSLDD